MVSILSFFQTKKKGKRARSRSPSPTQQHPPSSAPRPTQQPTPSGTSNTSRPTRFLSLRHKSGSSSSTKPYDLTGRRGSTNELTRKRNKGKSPEPSKPDLISAFIPKLDLAFDIPKTEDAIQKDSLDIHGVGEKVVLRRQEKEVISKLQLSVEEVKLAWEIFGKALRESDLNQHGLVLPLRPNTNPTTRLYLLALYCLVIRPDLLSHFPTIAAQFAQPTSNPFEIWRERLTSILKDGETSSDLSEVLKYILRRLQPTRPESLIDIGLYIAFVKAERSSSYPLDAFERLLSPRLKTGVATYLNEIFEVWSAMITHAEQNAMTPGRLAHLLGWWTWGCSTGKFRSWEELYKDWKSAGQRMEHLLYVWIRLQSTKTQLPTRLLDVVQDYPFGEASTTADQPPSPPPSSFPRQTLHVTLTSSLPVTGLFDTPEDILSSSLSAKLDENATAPLWSALKAVKDLDLSKILSTDSMKFLEKVTEPTDIPPTPNPAQMRSPILVNVTPSGQQPTSNGGTFRGRYHSHSGDLSSPATIVSSSTTSPNLSTLLNVGKDDESPKSVKKQASLGVLPKSGGSAWDDFQKSGFGDSSKNAGKLDLAFSPGSISKPVVPAASTIQLGANITEESVAKKRATFSDSKGSKAVYGIAIEEVVEIDDTFIAFVEDAQLDRPSTASWPPFSLVRLNPLVQPLQCEKVIEWLLITVVHHPPHIPVPQHKPQSTPELGLNRPTSPSSSKAGTPRGLKGITESFKRSSSFQSGMNLRRSFFGTSGFSLSLSRHASDELDTLPESESDNACQLRAPLSAASLTPTEYTITEMGEMIKIPSPNEKVEEAIVDPSASTGAGPSVVAEKEIDTDVATIKGKPMVTGLTTGPSVDTLVSQWKYAGEGAEHIVFSHRGTLSEYNGKVLRLRKSQFLGNSPTDPEYRQTLNEWTFNLLPQLVPLELLIKTHEVNLAEGWVKDLFTQADATRPEERKLLGDLKSLVVGEAKGVIMEDTTTNEKKDGIVSLAFEIKPKWGFLPDSSTVVPPEAAEVKSEHCRFCMHRHLKGHDSSAEGKFCPLDLYSGEEVRMKKAINGLWGIWEQSEGKENNWRVFVNGEKISPDKAEAVALYFDDEKSLADHIASSIIPILNSSQVVQTLKTLQATLDPTDISDLASRFSSAHPDAELFDPALIPSPTSAELKEFIKLYLSSPQAGKTGEAWTLRQRMIAFALSAIFKDCSVFVKLTLASSSPPLSPSTEKTEEKWSLVEGSGKVKIIDLDLKPIQNLGKWKTTDDKIWKHWLETHSSSTTQEIKNDTQDDDAVKVEEGQTLDIPIRHKAISGLTLSGVSEVGSTNTSDGASTRALFVPTPDRTRENTPLPTPAPVTVGSSMEDSLEPVDPPSNQNHQSESPVEDQGGSVPQAAHEAIDPRRTKRSMAPSPSPPPPPALKIPEQDEDRSKEIPKIPKDDVSSEVLLDHESTAQNRQQERDIPMPPTPHDDEHIAEPQKTNESSSIIGAGLAGLGSVVGLAAEAVHAIVEEFAEARSEKEEEKELLKNNAQVDDQSREVAPSEQDGVLAPEVHQATNPVGEPVSTEQPKVDIDIQPVPAVDNEYDGPDTNPIAPIEQLNTDNIISLEPAVIDERPKEEEAGESREYTPRAEEDRVNVEADTPQAELDNFYTPAETPLIPQPSAFDIPAELPVPVKTSDSSELPTRTVSSDKINDAAQEVSAEQANQVDAESSAGTPKMTIIPIEDATPKRDGDEAVSDSSGDQVDSAPVRIRIGDTSIEQTNAVVAPASTELNADTPLESVDAPEAATFKTEIPASLPSTIKDPAVPGDISSQDVSAPPQNSPEPPVGVAPAEEQPSFEVDEHSADQVPHDGAKAQDALIIQQSPAPPSVLDFETPSNQHEASASSDFAPVEADHSRDPLEDNKAKNTSNPVDNASASTPHDELSAGIHVPYNSGLPEETSHETAKASEIPPILGQPINSTTPTSSNTEHEPPSDNQPIISEDPTESQDHLSPLVADHHQAEEPVYDHHDLSTISEDGESSVPSSTDMSKDASLPTTDDGEQWVEDAQPSQEQEEEETPRAIHESLVEEVNVRRPVDEKVERVGEEEGKYVSDRQDEEVTSPVESVKESVSEPSDEIPTPREPAGALNENDTTPSNSTSIVKSAGEEEKIPESVVDPSSSIDDDGTSHLVEKEYSNGLSPQPQM
ncbi:hypothetical protein L486_05968 [Kwoniella mangroviensis CBS 10435]|uniref:Inositol-pentakisphosphate 2-kinase n=1 Tax=Kwoniella mangroviensis CBS 10435 TaxID=1331196 RepID=A0A1B9INE9_9TREE|nr:hypothetical protein L486_05968 [Kwoniella mangroviensis CBS 10435]